MAKTNSNFLPLLAVPYSTSPLTSRGGFTPSNSRVLRGAYSWVGPVEQGGASGGSCPAGGPRTGRI